MVAMAMASHFGGRALLCLGLATWAAAAATTSAPASGSATSSAAATHTVAVGADGFTFDPKSIQANVDDIVLFQFYEGNHSVARAEYEHPCIPYENLGHGRVGFWSGFEPVEGIPKENGPQFALKVNDTSPVFFYCSAVGACVPNGMIGVINPNKTQTLANQALFVKNASFQLSPGEAPPPESTSTGSSSNPSATANPEGSTSSSGGGLSKGAIAGIVVGAVVLVALAGLTFYLCGRNRTLASVLRYSHPPQPRSSTLPVTQPYSPDPTGTEPYTPTFAEHSPANKPVGAANPHGSWQPSMRSMSPEMSEGQGLMNQPQFQPMAGYANSQGHPSPGQAPWSPGGFVGAQQYSQVPQQHLGEMPTGQEHNLTPAGSPGFQNRASYLSQESQGHPQTSATMTGPQELATGLHEMDAQPSVPQTTSPPPEYMGRTFSFVEGGQESAPGVEKVLRD